MNDILFKKYNHKRLPLSLVLPLTISGLGLWFSPWQIPKNDGEFIDYVIDFSSIATPAVQYDRISRLVYRTNQTPNGKGVIEGSSGKYARFFLDTTGNTGFTFFTVSRYYAGANAQQEIILGSGGAGGTSNIRWGITGDFNTSTVNQRLGWAGTNAGISLGTISTPNTWKVRIFTKSTTAWNIYENGTLISGPISDTSMPTGIFNGILGAEQAANYYYRGYISDTGIYKKVLSSTEITKLNDYLMIQNGIS